MTGYDKNDNVLSSQCYGQTSASVYALIILTGNLLNHVDDTATTSAYNNGFEFKDGVKQANEYVYDANGNLTKDLNKGISNITYNVLNLPTGVTFASGGFIQYGYTADGIKRRMMYRRQMVRAIRFLLCIAAMWSMKTVLPGFFLRKRGMLRFRTRSITITCRTIRGTTALSSVPAVLLRKRLLSFWWGICKLRQCAAL